MGWNNSKEDKIVNKFPKFLAASLSLCLLLTGCGKEKAQPDSKTPDEPQQVLTQDEPQHNHPEAVKPESVGNNTMYLTSDLAPLKEMTQVKRDHYDNGTYYYMDATGENALRCISSSYLTTIREGETEEEYAQRRAIGMSVTLSPGNPYNLTVGKVDELSEALGYPVYVVTFLVGSDLKATCWTIYLTRTEHYSYQYAFSATAQVSLELEDEMMDYFRSLKLEPMPQA